MGLVVFYCHLIRPEKAQRKARMKQAPISTLFEVHSTNQGKGKGVGVNLVIILHFRD